MSEHPNVAVLRKGYDAMAQGDLPTVLGLFAEDGVMHVNAPAPLGGDHKGREAIGQALGHLVEWTGGTVSLQVREIFADDDHAVVLVRETATRAADGAALDVSEAHLFRLKNGEATEFWDMPAGPDRVAHDEFFGA
ncbi:MAG TPA: nuclear transport factor 2 family protein [Acidimicrobiales bacterium]|nr:nuclear transport factor 2 family protein [Acidimicrobiales bacterium]